MSNHETTWLQSPVATKAKSLRAVHRLNLEPFRGARRSLRLLRTHYVIGSDEACDIQLQDPFVSPRHAEIKLKACGEGFAIRDLDSRNGTFLNGVQVNEAPLPSRGTVRVGRSVIAWSPDAEPDNTTPDTDYIAADPAMRGILDNLRKVSATTLPILLLGETGTGKDVLARLVHQWSQRHQGPYVAVNGALTGGSLAESELFGHRKGAFTGAERPRLGALRSAHHGTLFLDEVADIPQAAQVKLLRSLEAKEVRPLGSDLVEAADFRLVSATSQDIDSRVASGAFRLDLYFRIAGLVVHVPPLRDRPEDILAMTRKWLADVGMHIHEEAEAQLLSYRWPGNVRELKAALERARIRAEGEGSPQVLSRHLVDLLRHLNRAEESIYRGRTLDEIEHECVIAALERNGWSRLLAARELGIARSTLFSKMKRFGIRDRSMVERLRE